MAKTKTTKEFIRELDMSLFSSEKGYKWNATIGGMPLECQKAYKTETAAKTAFGKWVKECLK